MRMDIRKGDFIRVKRDADFRAGQDGMVMQAPDGDGELGMMFHFDRYSVAQPGPFAGIEAWNVYELDLASLQR
jgi:hypothetical protein